MPRILLINPVQGYAHPGGLQQAVNEFRPILKERGWQVDVLGPRGTADVDFPLLKPLPTPDTQTRRQPVFVRKLFRSGLPKFMRLWRWRNSSVATLKDWSEQLETFERFDCSTYDIVLYLATGFDPPGTLALLTDKHPKLVLLTFDYLEMEASTRGLELSRWLARRRFPAVHPFVLRPIRIADVRAALIVSGWWHERTLRAGLRPEAAHLYYFGIPDRVPLGRTSPGTGRVLFVGRMSVEKGLHHLPAALALVRQQYPDLSLTIVAGDGSADYEALVQREIDRNGLRQRTTIVWNLPRNELARYYASHDVLFHWSEFDESVALTIMEAFQAGLPVVATEPKAPSIFVRNGTTCFTYHRGSPESLARAITRTLVEKDRVSVMTSVGEALVRNAFTLASTGNSLDRLLRREISEQFPQQAY